MAGDSVFHLIQLIHTPFLNQDGSDDEADSKDNAEAEAVVSGGVEAADSGAEVEFCKRADWPEREALLKKKTWYMTWLRAPRAWRVYYVTESAYASVSGW